MSVNCEIHVFTCISQWNKEDGFMLFVQSTVKVMQSRVEADRDILIGRHMVESHYRRIC
jgi:hypothetical protein